MRILDSRGMREADRRAIEEFGIASIALMENAARSVADAVTSRFPAARRPVVFCGKGNNGGDGMAAARHLKNRGLSPVLVLAAEAGELSGDAAANWEICRRMGIPATLLGGEEWRPALAAADLIIDALFGTGLAGDLGEPFAALVAEMNASGKPILAVDVPSGASGDSARLPPICVRAVVTVTFGALKIPHVFSPAAELCGEVIVADIGIPEGAYSQLPPGLDMIAAAQVAALVPPRASTAHKGIFGHVLIVAGSRGKGGAAILAARGAVRGGAGLVTVATPDPVAEEVDGGSLESMTVPLPATPDGAFATGARAALGRLLERKNAVVLGPGIGEHADAAELARRLALEATIPMVIDADGLNAWRGKAGRLRRRRAATILTPHPAELARLIDVSVAEILADRVAAVRRAREITGATVILKGARTLVATASGTVLVNPTGNPGMATGGSGDVLAGFLGALLAQGLAADDASAVGAYLHGLAGDLAAEARGTVGLAAGDIAEALPAAFVKLGIR